MSIYLQVSDNGKTFGKLHSKSSHLLKSFLHIPRYLPCQGNDYPVLNADVL